MPIGIYTQHHGVDVGIYTEQYGETKYLYLKGKSSVSSISIYNQNHFSRWVFLLSDIDPVSWQIKKVQMNLIYGFNQMFRFTNNYWHSIRVKAIIKTVKRGINQTTKTSTQDYPL